MTIETRKTRVAGTMIAMVWSIIIWMDQSSPASRQAVPSIEKQPPTCNQLEEEFNQVMRDWR